jgi:hypothetical protein
METSKGPTRAEADAKLTDEQRAVQDAIRAARANIDDELDSLRVKHEIEVQQVAAKGKMLKIRCKHPRAFLTGDYSGSTFSYCPDCEWDND